MLTLPTLPRKYRAGTLILVQWVVLRMAEFPGMSIVTLPTPRPTTLTSTYIFPPPSGDSSESIGVDISVVSYVSAGTDC